MCYRLKIGRSSGPVFIWFTAITLFMSGLMGVIMWPPPTLIGYETLINITGIEGPMGGVMRMIFATLAIIAWFLPYKWLRFFTYYMATLSTLLLSVSFFDSGQGFAAGAWMSSLLFGSMAIWLEGKVIREAEYDRDSN